MKKDLKQQNLALLGSLLLLAATFGGFFWLWKSAQPVEANIILDDKYNTVEIGSVKKEAQDLIQSKGNLVQMPIQAPIEGVGKPNPFVD